MKNIIFLSLVFVCFFSCKNRSKPPRKPLDPTACFDRDLRKDFRIHIPDSPHIYVVINEGCMGCQVITALYFDSVLNQNLNEPVTVLIKYSRELDEKFLNNPKVIANDTSYLFRLWFFGYNTITLIGTSNKKIDAILNFDSPDMDSLPVRYARLKQRAGP